ncbi:MAG: hypothetical protein GY791_08575 [Alphaproteobacteria bacterium]|nr:hypothetical protein [Alphaproteobacteria bacterium]
MTESERRLLEFAAADHVLALTRLPHPAAFWEGDHGAAPAVEFRHAEALRRQGYLELDPASAQPKWKSLYRISAAGRDALANDR